MFRTVLWGGLVTLALCLTACSDDAKKGVGELCSSGSECEDKICHRGTCCPFNPLSNGSPCKLDAECRSFSCVSSTCAPGTLGAGEACYHSEECASKTCTITDQAPGVCATRSPDSGTPDAGVDAALPDAKPDLNVQPDVQAEASADLPAPDVTPTPDVTPDIWPDLCKCGNNKVECAEVCDGTDLNGKTLCTDHGYAAGLPDCAKDCNSFDLKDCYSFPDTTNLQVSKDTYTDSFPKAVYDKTNGTWLVVWEKTTGNRHIHTAIVDASGKVIVASQKIVSDTGQNDFDVAFDGTDYVIAYYVGGTQKGIYISRIDAKTGALVSGSTKPLFSGTVSFTQPKIAQLGSTWLLAWQEGKNVVGQRVSGGSSGFAVVGAKFTIATPPSSGNTGIQALGTDGSSWLALWHQPGSGSRPDLYARHVLLNATMSTPVAVAKVNNLSEKYAAMVHTVGSRYLVTWIAKTSMSTTPYVCDVMAVLVDAKYPAVTVGTPFTVYTKCGDYMGTSASYDPDYKTYLAVFGWNFNNGDIKAQRFGHDPVTGALRLEDATPRLICTATGQQKSAHAAFGAKHHLIVWNDYRAPTAYESDIYAARYR